MEFDETRKLILTLLVVAVIYSVLAFFVLPSNSFFAGDEGVKFLQTKSLTEKGWKDPFIDYPGREFDIKGKFYPFNPPYVFIRQGKMYSTWPLFYPVVNSIFYRCFGMRGLYVVPVLSSLVTLILVAYMSRMLTNKLSVLPVVALAFGTPLFFYSLVFWEHSFGTMLATLAVFFLLKTFFEPQNRYYLASGIALGFAIWARNELYALALAMLISYVVVSCRKRRDIFQLRYLVLGLVLILVPMWIFQKATTGAFLGTDVSQFLSKEVITETTPYLRDVGSFILYKLYIIATLILHPFNHKENAYYGFPFLLFAVAVFHPKLRRGNFILPIAIGSVIFTAFLALFSQCYWYLFGLLTVSPFIVYALLARPVSSDSSSNSGVDFLFYICFFFILLVLLFSSSYGGTQWGPRFLLPAFPLLVVLVYFVYENFQRLGLRKHVGVIAKGGLLVLVLVSVVIQVIGIQFLQLDRRSGAELAQYIRSREEGIFITDTFWFPQESASVYSSKVFFSVNDEEELRELVAILLERGLKRFCYVTYQENTGPLKLDEVFVEKNEIRAEEAAIIPNRFTLTGYSIGY
ncbi:MAG: glycosyltransferase family 39 protein [Actinomycetota bacterium]|nr:glycosyltransferase family 39 protein [Actinomycetota bacterium]